MDENPLNWESSYAIALKLKRLHPLENLEQVSLNQIYEWTIALPEFEDDPSLANDDILLSIYQDWLEEILNDQS
jgi:FeS assembly protein IscX